VEPTRQSTKLFHLRLSSYSRWVSLFTPVCAWAVLEQIRDVKRRVPDPSLGRTLHSCAPFMILGRTIPAGPPVTIDLAFWKDVSTMAHVAEGPRDRVAEVSSIIEHTSHECALSCQFVRLASCCEFVGNTNFFIPRFTWHRTYGAMHTINRDKVLSSYVGETFSQTPSRMLVVHKSRYKNAPIVSKLSG
jgi:hypothetical protein